MMGRSCSTTEQLGKDDKKGVIILENFLKLYKRYLYLLVT